MKTKASSEENQCGPDHFSSEPAGDDFEYILELARMGVASTRKNDTCIQKHRLGLKTKGESEERQREFANWRHSLAFTAREKAAIGLSESISSEESKEASHDMLEEARSYFDSSEMLHLTLAIIAVNDWINLHADSPVCVLVVEDNPMDQELLRRQLRKVEMEKNVAFVSDGLEALALLMGTQGELFRSNLVAIFLDIHLPGMNGIELLQQIRTLPEMEEFPVIVMSSSTNPRDRAECNKLGIASYIEKPVTASSFSNAVANIFHQAKTA